MNTKGLYNRLATYVEDVKACRREIDRQKLMLDRSKIVLSDDFFHCAFWDHEGADALRTVFSHHVRGFTENYLGQIRVGKAPTFAIPVRLVAEETKDRRRAFEAHGFAEESPGLGEYAAHYAGGYLGDMLKALDTVDGHAHYLDSAERVFLIGGDRWTLVDFWKNINGLKDYSSLFPNRPPPPGNGEKKKGRDDAKQRSWKPVWVPG